MPDLGYKHKSPEQALVPSSGTQEMLLLPEDDLTAAIINGLSVQLKVIARLHWSNNLTDREIAKREKLSRAKVRTRIRWIKQQVVDSVLM